MQAEYERVGWPREWAVLGLDELSGDPIVADTSDSAHPVFLAWCGEEDWVRERLAGSVEAFARILAKMKAFSAGRETPVEFEARPLTEAERREIIATIYEADANSNVAYWESAWLAQG